MFKSYILIILLGRKLTCLKTTQHLGSWSHSHSFYFENSENSFTQGSIAVFRSEKRGESGRPI